VDSSLAVFFDLVLKLFVTDEKDQPPQPDLLENQLI
jgi:hypothetical protein